MKTGDLVKVSNNGFVGIGYITEVCDTGYYVVHYFSSNDNEGERPTGGLWTLPYMTLLKEVINEKEISKT
tara:strand:+ start:395 stop:604 length:210 start_codon:yes stop_codon:yes gene_type:complete